MKYLQSATAAYRAKRKIAALSIAAASAVLAGCGSHPTLGRVETRYKALGGPNFVGADGGTDQSVVNNWFDAHPEHVDTFNGEGGLCNGYEPAPAVAQRENTVCAGAARATLKRMMK